MAGGSDLFVAPRHPYTAGCSPPIPGWRAAPDTEAPAITGDPPSPLHIPSGCRFRTRCPMAQQRCEEEDPELTGAAAAPGHLAACHFAFAPAPPTGTGLARAVEQA